MTPDRKKDDREIDLPVLVSQLQQLAEKIRHQVDQELTRMEQARHSAAQESARLEELLAKTSSAFPGSRQDSQNSLPQAPCDSVAQQSQPISDTLKRHQETYSLAEKGLEPLEIAQRTGRTLGEIQVILALRKSE